MFKKKKKEIKEMLAVPQEDRRILPNVPDPENIRSTVDRRGIKEQEGKEKSGYINQLRMLSLRYISNFDVFITAKSNGKKMRIKARSVDISVTGLLVELEDGTGLCDIGEIVEMRFVIPAGAMPEGFDSKVKLDATLVRSFKDECDGGEKQMMAFEFAKPLTDYLHRKRWRYSIFMASSFIFIIVALVMLMRVESAIYFKYNKILYLYSFIAAAFLLTRYLFGSLYRNVPVNPEFTPGVSIIIPCFNEEKWIHRTILSCMNQEYPIDKLEVIVVDDCSTDGTVSQIKKVQAMIHEVSERYLTKERLAFYSMRENGGKREALMRGVKMAKHDLVVFVDSDSFLDPAAIKHLVQPFQDPKMGGVAGRTDVENKYTNAITKLQTVRYYIAFRIMKAAESWFDSVTCLSGPLSCYRKELILEHSEAWINQTFLGHPATFGDDRSMTNMILRTHRTAYQDEAVCSTIVPSDTSFFLKQQMRWKRSWLRESLIASTFIWRKEPLMALFFYIGVLVPIAAPIVVLYNMVYVPIMHQVFPITFMMGLLLMALLLSFAHLLFRRSKLWVFGFVFVAFYEIVLLWQMPVAWFTFWKSTWGTRETPQDIEARLRKEERKQKYKKKTG